MKTQQLQHQKETSYPQNKNIVWHMAAGMVIGIIITLTVGYFIDNIPAGIATGPALGAGIGLAIHSIYERKSDTYARFQQSIGFQKILYSLLILGICVLAFFILYSII